MTLDEARLALEAGRTTSRALVETCLDRIADPAGEGRRTFVKTYADQARASADAMDALRRAGRAPGPFAGIPVSIKDLLDVAGEPTPAGSVILADAPPAAAHAAAVQRLLAAGLVLIGRTNMTEFAFSGIGINPHYGTPLSPYDRATGRIPGGSSSGAAVSVADGMALAALGTDTGGSCRIPAAFCGVTGFKPTARRVPLDGCLPLSPSLDSIGPLAQTAACCAAIDAILAGETWAPLPERSVAGLRLALPTNVGLDFLDAPTERAIDRTVERLDRAGALIDRRRIASLDAIDGVHARGGFAVPEAYTYHRQMLQDHGASYDQRVADRIRPGATMPVADYIALCQARPGIIAAFEAEVAPYDALLMPTVPIAPPPLAAFARDDTYRRLNAIVLRNPAVVNFLDGCAISLPCHEPGAPPAGLMLVAPAMRDRALFAIAQAVERAVTAWPQT
jgi:aspartyl-tRNA(Asn)/glutamyl-tRNA(Gln) amidotransferase subunit A